MLENLIAQVRKAGTTVPVVGEWLATVGKKLPNEVSMVDFARVRPVRERIRLAVEAHERHRSLGGTADAGRARAALDAAAKAFEAAVDAGDDEIVGQATDAVIARAEALLALLHAGDHAEKKSLKRDVAERDQAQATLAGRADWLKGVPELAAQPALATALEDYRRLLAGGQKNGGANAQALADLLQALRALGPIRSDEVRKEVAAMIATADAELARVQRVRATVDAAASGRGALKFADVPSRGDPTTTARQNAALKAMIEQEASRSNVFAKLLDEIMQPGQATLEIVAGRGSCGLFDSFMEGTVDTRHFDILPAEPVLAAAPGAKAKKVGLTQGEILVHVLEERLYSRQRAKGDDAHFHDCGDYNHAHNKCLAPGSYQNLYRRERGIGSDTLQLTDGKTRDGAKAFQHMASDGTTAVTPIGGINDADFVPDAGRFEYEVRDGDGHAVVTARFRDALAKKFRAKRLTDERGRFDRSKLDASATADWKIWLAEQLGDAARADALVEAEVARLGAEFEARYRADAERAARQNRAATDFLKAKKDADLSPGSRALREARARRGAHVNDGLAQFKAYQERRKGMAREAIEAEDDQLPLVTDTSRVNCAVTTVGAICGSDSTGFVQGWFRANGRADLVDTHGGFQGDDMWAYIEEGRLPAPLDNDPDLREELNGDAQLRGLRGALLAEADKRRQAGQPSTVVQDGVNDHGGMVPADELVARMAGYPDGTQFEVFVKGDMAHWVYAEMFDGQLVFEDYQMSSTDDGAKKAPAAKLATSGKPAKPAADGMPDNPLSGLGGAFTQGMFLAIAPVADPAALPQRKTDPGWPEPGSADDTKLRAFMAALAKLAAPEQIADELRRHADVPAAWCDTAAVAAAIDAARDAYGQLAAPRELRAAGALPEAQVAALAAAVARVRAGNKQIDRLLKARVVDRMRFPPVSPIVVPTVEAKLLDELDAARDVVARFGLDAPAFLAAVDEARKLGPGERWRDDDVARRADALDKQLRAAATGVTAGAPAGLADQVGAVAMRLDLPKQIGLYRARVRVDGALPDLAQADTALARPHELAQRLAAREGPPQPAERTAALGALLEQLNAALVHVRQQVEALAAAPPPVPAPAFAAVEAELERLRNKVLDQIADDMVEGRAIVVARLDALVLAPLRQRLEPLRPKAAATPLAAMYAVFETITAPGARAAQPPATLVAALRDIARAPMESRDTGAAIRALQAALDATKTKALQRKGVLQLVAELPDDLHSALKL